MRACVLACVFVCVFMCVSAGVLALPFRSLGISVLSTQSQFNKLYK